jgi:hypothetical protein
MIPETEERLDFFEQKGHEFTRAAVGLEVAALSR